jgi:hypothetical protein
MTSGDETKASKLTIEDGKVAYLGVGGFEKAF